jgi:hypothetical protein
MQEPTGPRARGDPAGSCHCRLRRATSPGMGAPPAVERQLFRRAGANNDHHDRDARRDAEDGSREAGCARAALVAGLANFMQIDQRAAKLPAWDPGAGRGRGQVG